MRHATPGEWTCGNGLPQIHAKGSVVAMRECIIGTSATAHTLPMRKLILLLATLLVSGCGMLYRQPIFQGNLLKNRQLTNCRLGWISIK